MAACGPDVISLCHTVDMEDAAARLPLEKDIAFQGNVDPAVLFGNKRAITERIHHCVGQAKRAGLRHILNLGHGVLVVSDGCGKRVGCRRSMITSVGSHSFFITSMQGTSENAVAHFFEEAKSIRL